MLKLEKEDSTIRLALQMSTILAGIFMAVIVLGCSAKNFERVEESKNGPSHEHQNESKEKEQQDETKKL